MSSTISAYRDNHCKYYFCVCSFLSGKHTCTHTHDLYLHIDMYICVCVCTIIIFYKHDVIFFMELYILLLSLNYILNIFLVI